MVLMSPIKEISSSVGIVAPSGQAKEEAFKGRDGHQGDEEVEEDSKTLDPGSYKFLSNTMATSSVGIFQPIISPSRASAMKSSGNMKERRASLSLVIGASKQPHLLSPHSAARSVSGGEREGRERGERGCQLSKISPRNSVHRASACSNVSSGGASSSRLSGAKGQLWRKKRQATAIGLVGMTSPAEYG